MNKIVIFIIVLVLISPLGLVLPFVFNSGCAWGEWGSDELTKMLGYVPYGIAKFSNVWHPLFPDYKIAGSTGVISDSVFYVLSGIIGAVSCIGVSLFWLRR